jgi:hypothetical protein
MPGEIARDGERCISPTEEIRMAKTDRWIDPNQNGDPWTTASDWSAGVPTSTSNVTVAEGNPIVEAGSPF